MTFLLTIIAVALVATLTLVASIRPLRSRFSTFETARRKSDSHSEITLDEHREALFGDVTSLQHVIQAVLLVLFTVTVVALYGWIIGSVIAVVVSLGYGKISSIASVRRAGSKLYAQYESHVLDFVSRWSGSIRFVRTFVPALERTKIGSREELASIVTDSADVLTHDEISLITASLKFDGKQVGSIMTPKSVIETVKKNEILGPLVLHDLHETGHSRFPVIDEDIDHIVGILYVRDVLTLDTSKKHTSKVETAMSRQVYYIREDHSLPQALAAFLKTHHHMFIVINEYRETVGIITLEDTLEALLGRRIIDEFDAHDDMRAVAARNATLKSAPNHSPASKDV